MDWLALILSIFALGVSITAFVMSGAASWLWHGIVHNDWEIY